MSLTTSANVQRHIPNSGTDNKPPSRITTLGFLDKAIFNSLNFFSKIHWRWAVVKVSNHLSTARFEQILNQARLTNKPLEKRLQFALNSSLILAAIKKNNPTLISKLIEIGADINAKVDNDSLLANHRMLFVLFLPFVIINHLYRKLKTSFNLDIYLNSKMTPLSSAIWMKKNEAVKALLQKKGLDITESFHLAAKMGNEEALKALLEYINNDSEKLILLKDKNGLTPLHTAANYSLAATKVFLDKNISANLETTIKTPNARFDFHNITPLFLAKSPEIIEALAESGANINHTIKIDKKGLKIENITLLMFITIHDYFLNERSMLRSLKLIDLGANQNFKYKTIKKTTNTVAIEEPFSFILLDFFNSKFINEEIFRKFLNSKLDLELTDKNTDNLLIKAAKSKNIRAIEILLECYANPKAKNAEGKNAYFYLSKYLRDLLSMRMADKLLKKEFGV